MAASSSSRDPKSSEEGVLICISKANDDIDRSFLYVSKLEGNRIGQGNPVHLGNPRSGMDLWRNADVFREKLRLGAVIKFRIEENKYVYDGKTERKVMDINQIQMGLDFEINSYRGISDACPGVVFLPGNHHFNNYCFLHGKPKEDQIFIVAIAKGCIFSERISLLTRNGERVFLKVNCRENLTMSTAPFHLCVKECEDKDVGDVAIIKFIESTSGPLPTSYIAVCEGLILQYKPKVISVEDEPVEIMNAGGMFIDCPRVVTFDTGNSIATAISKELVKELNLEDRIDDKNKRRYTGVVRDDDGKPISKLCSTIKISIKIRRRKFNVEALYNVTAENTGLLIGMDIIDQLFDQEFTLGK